MNSELKELTRAVAAHDPAREVHADPHVMAAALDEIIRGSETGAASQVRGSRRLRRRQHHGRRWASVAATAAVACTVVGLTAILGPGRIGALHLGPDRAEALSFSRDGDHIDVRILDPDADPARYRQEFAAHGMDVDLRMRAVSPSLVGAMIGVWAGPGTEVPTTGNGVTMLDGERDCGAMWCKAGVRISTSLKSHVGIEFGRAARQGEPYELSADATAPGEPLAGLAIRGRTVADVTRLAAARNARIIAYSEPTVAYTTEPAGRADGQPLKVAIWRYDGKVLQAGEVPDGWYVQDAFTGDLPQTLRLTVRPDRSGD